MVANLPGVVFQYVHRAHRDGEFLYLSPNCKKVYGIEIDAAMVSAQAIWGLYNPIDVQNFFIRIGQQAAALDHLQWIAAVKTPSGTSRWIQIDAQPEVTDNGEVILNGVAADITQRKVAEDRTRSLAAVIEHSYSIVLITDFEGSIEYANKKFSEITGYSFEEVRGKNARILNTGNQSKEFYRHLWETIKSGKEWYGEFCNKKKSGELYWEAAMIAPIKDEQGRVTNFIAIKQDITGGRQMRRMLEDSQQLVKSVFTTAAVPICLADENGYFVEVNPACSRLFGYNHEELVSKHFTLLLPHGQREVARNAYKNFITNISYKSTEQWLGLHKDGTVMELFTTAGIFRNADQKPFIVLTFIDITDRKKLEEVRRKQNRLLRGAAEAMQHLLVSGYDDSGIQSALQTLGLAAEVDRVYLFQNTHDYRTGELLMNQRYEWVRNGVSIQIDNPDLQNLSYAPGFSRWQEILSKGNVISGFVKDFSEGEREILESQDIISLLVIPVMADNLFWGFIGFDECRFERVWIEAEKSILVAAAASIGAGIARKNAIHALYESENRYRSVVDSVSEVIFQTDLQGNWTFLNSSWVNMTGYDVTETLGTNILDYVHAEDRDSLLSEIRPLLGRIIDHMHIEVRYITKNEEVRWVEIDVQLNLDQNGNISGSSGTLTNITEKKVAQQKQEKLLKELKAVNKELREFAYVVSHDLKAPLRAIGSLSSWLHTDYADKIDEAGREQLDLLMGRVKRMHDLIEGILQYSRIGRVKEEVVWVDLGEVVMQAVEMVLPPKGIKVAVKGELPKVRGDRTRMQQVFQNLLSNAVKYMDKEEGVIEVGSREEVGSWEVYVKDNGPGIEEKYHEKIFQIFQTLSPRDERESTGIGLTIVKKIVEGYGGEVRVESELGKGSVFWIRLPKEIRDSETRNDTDEIKI
ncbi:MAG: PAS domain S-box protein [Chlorobiales bacterium]|nr:PAS domain S-box protein [Chlorobiales bacterium]